MIPLRRPQLDPEPVQAARVHIPEPPWRHARHDEDESLWQADLSSPWTEDLHPRIADRGELWRLT